MLIPKLKNLMTEMPLANVARKKNVLIFVGSKLNKVLHNFNECLFICVDFRCVANHMQMWLGKKW